MSMAISATDYFSNLYQTTSSSEGKNGQKGVSAEVGQTQESPVSASLDQANLGQEGIAVTEVRRQQGGEATAQKSSSAPRMDTVEISAEGRVALQASSAESEEAASSEPEDLSEYTSSELKQMYYKGEITRQEYEDATGESLD